MKMGNVVGWVLFGFCWFALFFLKQYLPSSNHLVTVLQTKKTKHTHVRRVLLIFSILVRLSMKFRIHSSFKETALQQKQADGIEA